MEFLTENDIKKAALRFLKSHYKYRPRIGDSQARLDNITQSGIIADGLLTFQTDIDNRFEATFEATSYAKAHEVKYRVRNIRLWWDSIMVGFILTTIIFAILYNGNHLVIGAHRVWVAAIGILLTILFLTMTYKLLCRSLSSYREIYALEQFKLYDADEQWVAVGVDVFENPQDKYLNELKRQCVLYGFGLMIVEKDLDIRQSITPSQIPLEGRKRREAQFEALAENTPTEKGTGGALKNYTDSIALSLGWEKEKRFSYNFGFQLVMILLCSVIIGLMLWKESKKIKEVDHDNSAYKNMMRKKNAELEREGNYYIIDEEDVVKFRDTVDEYDMGELRFYDEDEVARWYNKHHQDSLLDMLNNDDKRSRDEILDSLNKELAKDTFNVKEKPKPVAAKPKPKPQFSPICQDYVNWWGKRYILKDGAYKSRKTAEARLEQINKASVMGGILKGGCFQQTKPYYIVYVDVVYTNKDKAQTWLPYFNKLLKDKGYSSGELDMITVTVKR